MKTLLLTSAGMQVKDEILKLLTKTPQQTKIAHITTATNTVKDAPWRTREKRRMIEIGFQVEDIDIEGKSERELTKLFEGKDIIYVQGGDPYYLLKQVKVSGFDTVVKNLIEKGTIYIGVSAGSYIACPTIEMSLWKKPQRSRHGLKDNESAMNLIPFVINVHYEPKYEKLVKAGIAKTKYPVRVLTDDQAILVRGSDVKLVGKGEEITLL